MALFSGLCRGRVRESKSKREREREGRAHPPPPSPPERLSKWQPTGTPSCTRARASGRPPTPRPEKSEFQPSPVFLRSEHLFKWHWLVNWIGCCVGILLISWCAGVYIQSCNIDLPPLYTQSLSLSLSLYCTVRKLSHN